jgi:pimeloyl-ACP methyl ester carboxylesterase
MFAFGNLILLVLIGLGLALVALAARGARQLIYPLHRRAGATPADYGLAFEPVAFHTRDGLTLRGWFIPAAASMRALIFCHGYSGDCSPDLIHALLLRGAGYNLLLFDFRGHGASGGNSTSVVYFERADVVVALE